MRAEFENHCLPTNFTEDMTYGKKSVSKEECLHWFMSMGLNVVVVVNVVKCHWLF